jgi:phosphoenolpyruvate carboxylase
MDPDDLFNEITNQTVEIVLTAHPTQVNRRTLQYKHAKIAALLQQHDRWARDAWRGRAAACRERHQHSLAGRMPSSQCAFHPLCSPHA